MTARTLAIARPTFGTIWLFALPIGLSAFLLFSVEPLVGRLVLPVFGGTPAVWAPSTRLTSRAWKRCAIRPPGSFRVVI